MSPSLTPLYNSDLFKPIDIHFANYIQEISDANTPEVHLAAALVSMSTRYGNICLDLNTVSNNPQFNNEKPDNDIVFPNTSDWADKLSACSAVGKPGDDKPLILDSRYRLYFYRYWEYEKNIADAIKERIDSPVENINDKKLIEGVNRIFGSVKSDEMDMQKAAAISAVHSRFSVISGGPGTGKTTTVSKILALLIEQYETEGVDIILCTPTGKAAASLSETIRAIKTTIQCDETTKTAIPVEAFTIHRLLGSIPRSPYFKHNRDNPLHADVVIIDEASMVDVALMAKLFNAIPKDTRIILVGDKDQLSSVEAGSALGDICNREIIDDVSKGKLKRIKPFLKNDTEQIPAAIEQQKNIREHILVLDKNYRFDEHSGIGGLSRAINNGDSETGLNFLMDPGDKNVVFYEVAEPKTVYSALREKVVQRYSQYLAANDPYQALDLFNQFKILCALRSGPFGVDTINRRVQNILFERGLIRFDEREDDPMYKGRPILITQNDYTVGLFNGDTGIIMPESGSSNGELQAVFPLKKDEIKKVPTHRLPDHETVYAMTIHKSQGSEFNDVMIILPNKYYPILTRELIYTGITRAMNSVTIWGTKEVLKKSIEKKNERTSGLRDALWD